MACKRASKSTHQEHKRPQLRSFSSSKACKRASKSHQERKPRQLHKTFKPFQRLPPEIQREIVFFCLQDEIEKDWEDGPFYMTTPGYAREYARERISEPRVSRKYALLRTSRAMNSMICDCLWHGYPISFECDAKALESHPFPWEVPVDMFKHVRHCRFFIGLNADNDTRCRDSPDSLELQNAPKQMRDILSYFHNLTKVEISFIDRIHEGAYRWGNDVPEEILGSVLANLKECCKEAQLSLTLLMSTFNGLKPKLVISNKDCQATVQ